MFNHEALTPAWEKADELVQLLGLDGKVDDYEAQKYSDGAVHTYFLEYPLVLQIFPDWTARLIEVLDDTDLDTGRVLSVTSPLSISYSVDGKVVGSLDRTTREVTRI